MDPYFIQMSNFILQSARNFTFSITIIVIAFIDVLYKMFINKSYYDSIVYVPILAVSVYYLCMSAFYGNIYTAYKDTKILGISSFVAAVINLLVDILLYQFIHVYAAAISTLIAAIYLFVNRKIKSRKYIVLDFKSDILIDIVFIIITLLYYLETINNSLMKIVSFFLFVIANRRLIILIFNRIKKRKNVKY